MNTGLSAHPAGLRFQDAGGWTETTLLSATLQAASSLKLGRQL